MRAKTRAPSKHARSGTDPKRRFFIRWRNTTEHVRAFWNKYQVAERYVVTLSRTRSSAVWWTYIETSSNG